MNGVLVTLLALVVSVAGEDLTVGTELAYFFFQPEGEVRVHFERNFEPPDEKCCGEKIKFLAGVVLKR